MPTPIRFIHYRTIENDEYLNHGGNTLAYFTTDEGTVRYSVSRCSYRDQYSKHVGRAVTRGRLEAGRFEEFYPQEGTPMTYQVLEHARSHGIIQE